MRRKTEHKPILYLLTYTVIKFALRVFFQKIDIRHRQNVPVGKPVVLVANHPNSIMDALVLGVVANRKVNYIVHVAHLDRLRAEYELFHTMSSQKQAD